MVVAGIAPHRATGSYRAAFAIFQGAAAAVATFAGPLLAHASAAGFVLACLALTAIGALVTAAHGSSIGAGLHEPVRREPAPGALCSYQARFRRTLVENPRTHPVRVTEELADDQATAGLEHARQLAQGRIRVRDLTEHGHQERGIELGVRVGQPARIALGRHDVRDAAAARPLERVVEHLLLEVEHVELPARPDPLGDIERVVPGPGTYLEHALAGLGREHRPQARARGQGVGCLDPEALAVRHADGFRRHHSAPARTVPVREPRKTRPGFGDATHGWPGGA